MKIKRGLKRIVADFDAISWGIILISATAIAVGVVNLAVHWDKW